MVPRRWLAWLGAALLVVSLPAAAAAQGVLTLSAGYFAVRGEDGRPQDDVLVRNLDFLIFDLDSLSGFTFGGEWHYPIGDYLEAGGGVGFYKHSVPSVYRDYVDNDGSEIAQEIDLRVVPITATVKFFPLTRHAPVQPYIGAGLGIFVWRYAETGEFVDFSDCGKSGCTIFRNNYVDEGTEYGPVVFGGVLFPMGDVFTVGVEFRYQDAKATLDASQGFAGERIDLGGYTTMATFGLRF